MVNIYKNSLNKIFPEKDINVIKYDQKLSQENCIPIDEYMILDNKIPIEQERNLSHVISKKVNKSKTLNKSKAINKNLNNNINCKQEKIEESKSLGNANLVTENCDQEKLSKYVNQNNIDAEQTDGSNVITLSSEEGSQSTNQIV